MSIKNLLFGCVAAIAMAHSGAAAAAADPDAGPVALVMSVTGSVSPETAPYTELAPETRLDLGADGKLTFVHYPSCRLVTVSGGKLNFTAEEVQLDGGAIENEKPQKCPKQLKMKIAGVAGGVRLRSIPTAFLAEKPVCSLVGAANRTFVAARVIDGDEPVAEVPLSGPVLRWPADAPALTANKLYRLELMPKVTGTRGMAIDFAVSKDAPSGETECLLRVE